jgi:hypothetical protein
MKKSQLKIIVKSVIKEIVEGYGYGDPKKDPKAVGRWTVKFQSTSKPLKEKTCSPHKSPSGKITNMCSDDDDYNINYGPNKSS